MPKLNKSAYKIALIVASAIVLIILGVIGYRYFFGNQNTIQVNGQSVFEVTPDSITIYFNVETQGETSKEAGDANSVIVNELKSSLVSLGFKETDLKTQNYNIYPEYDYKNGQELTGYKATHSLKIELSIDKQDKIGDIIDAGTNAGAGLSYINFELTPALQQQSKAEAIKLAAADAKIKAESMALGFNKRLGRLVSVSLDNFNYYPTAIYESSQGGTAVAKDAVASITPSSQEVSAYVTAVYKLW